MSEGSRYHRRMHIRLVKPSDAEPIRAIYNVEVLGSTATFDLRPRTPEEQQEWMAVHRGPHPAPAASNAATSSKYFFAMPADAGFV